MLVQSKFNRIHRIITFLAINCTLGFPVYLETPDHARCTNMILMKKNNLLGKMTELNDNVWTTENPFYFRYEYTKEVFGKVSNAILHKINIYYDIYTNSLSSNLVDVSHCMFSSGFCRTEH